MRHLRWPERLLIAYFVYTAVLAQLLPLRSEIRLVTAALNAIVMGGFLLLARVDSLRRRPFLSMVRDWYPMPLMLLTYREMGWFAQPRADFHLENAWVVYDRILLRDLGLKAALEALGPVVPSILEISYSLVYTVPFLAMAALYACGKRERVPAFQATFVLSVISAYALFPLFPSEPPRTVFPGQDFPAYLTVFRRFNWGLLGGYGIHTSVFPSAHVSGSFSGALAMIRLLPERKWVGRALLVLAILIATATVYGRYHYAVDAAAGFALAAAGYLGGRVRLTSCPRR